jgi:hypothetical protein
MIFSIYGNLLNWLETKNTKQISLRIYVRIYFMVNNIVPIV